MLATYSKQNGKTGTRAVCGVLGIAEEMNSTTGLRLFFTRIGHFAA